MKRRRGSIIAVTALLCTLLIGSAMSLISLFQLRIYAQKEREDSLQKELDRRSFQSVMMEYTKRYAEEVWQNMMVELEGKEGGFTEKFLESEFVNRSTTSKEALTVQVKVRAVAEAIGAESVVIKREETRGITYFTYSGGEQRAVQVKYSAKICRGSNEESMGITVMTVIPTCDFDDSIFCLKEEEITKDIIERIPEFNWNNYIHITYVQ